MKNILRIYKMFYRLLRLKQKQRRELENKYSSMFRIYVSGVKDDYELTKLELSDWKRTALLFGIENPLQLFKALNKPNTEDINKTATEQRLNAIYRGFSMILRIQKKPEFYRAIIFDGQNGIDVQEFCKERLVSTPKANKLVISTNGSDQLALPGYYIIEKSENNFFVLSPSEFKAQYNIIQQYPKITRL